MPDVGDVVRPTGNGVSTIASFSAAHRELVHLAGNDVTKAESARALDDQEFLGLACDDSARRA